MKSRIVADRSLRPGRRLAERRAAPSRPCSPRRASAGRPTFSKRRLQLRAAPGLVRRGCQRRRHKPGGAGHRARLPGVIGQVARRRRRSRRRRPARRARRALGEGRHLLLHLHRAGIGAPGAAGVLVDPLLDDLRAELLRPRACRRRRAPCPRGGCPRSGTSGPALPHEVLRQRVGQHRVRSARCAAGLPGSPRPAAGRRSRGVQDDRLVAGYVGELHRYRPSAMVTNPPDPGVEQLLHLRFGGVGGAVTVPTVKSAS